MKETLEVRIGKYLSGEMTGHEREEFEQQIAADDSLKNLLLATTRIWDNQPDILVNQWDTQTAWNKFEQRLDVQASASVPVRRLWMLRVAAIMILAVGAYYLFFNADQPVHYSYTDEAHAPVPHDLLHVLRPATCDHLSTPLSFRLRI